MLNIIKRIGKKVRSGVEISAEATRHFFRSVGKRSYSQFDEEKLIPQYDATIGSDKKTPFIVEIAAWDGVSMSNTYALFRKGMPGLAVEFNDEHFAKLSATYRNLHKVKLLKQMITPENVDQFK